MNNWGNSYGIKNNNVNNRKHFEYILVQKKRDINIRIRIFIFIIAKRPFRLPFRSSSIWSRSQSHSNRPNHINAKSVKKKNGRDENGGGWREKEKKESSSTALLAYFVASCQFCILLLSFRWNE